MVTLFLILIVLNSVLMQVNGGQTSGCSLNKVLRKIQSRLDSQEINMKKIDPMAKTLKRLESAINNLIGIGGKDCADLFNRGIKQNGVYTIKPRDSSKPIKVFCDMKTDGGGWTVFQTREDGSVDFYRGWNEYKHGFGRLGGEFWLGNDNINRLTRKGSYQLRVDLEDTTGHKRYALYDAFSIASEKAKYKLSLGTYSGNAGDSLGYHRGSAFSTKDRDNDTYPGGSCAVHKKGAWWYRYCHHSNLNGLYHHGAHTSAADGVNWFHFKGDFYSLKRTSMKFRPVGFKSK